MLSTPISQCRICSGESLSEVFSLGDLASCGAFPSKSQPDAPKAPLTLVQCETCGLVQLAHNFRGDDLFRHSYGYRSGINESMVRHLRDIASTVMQRAKFAAGDIEIVDSRGDRHDRSAVRTQDDAAEPLGHRPACRFAVCRMPAA